MTDKINDKLFENMPLLFALIDNIPNPVYCQDVHGFYFAYNRAFQDLFDTPLSESYIGKTVFDLPISLEEAVAHHRADLELFRSPGSKTYEGTLTFPDGSIRHIISKKTTFQRTDGSTGGIITYVTDTTESKEVEDTFRKNEARLKYLAEASLEALIFIENGIIVDVNNRMYEMFGYDEGEILGGNILDVIVPDRGTISNDILASDSGHKYETNGLHKDGTLFPIEVYSRELDLKDKRVWISAVRDLTEQKNMEDEILKSKNLQSVGTLANGIAHDFNNLLAAIVGNVSLAKISAPKDSKMIHYLSEAERITLMGKNLTQQLLTFSRSEDSVRKIADITPIIRDTTEKFLSGSLVRAEYTIPTDLFPVEIDEDKIRQVIQNIVVNAKESMSSEGTIFITCENVNISSQHELPIKEPHIRILIHDEGIGIPEENLSKIFDPYFTTKDMGPQKGVGLGLAICYSIIKKHKGYILVNSVPGGGTTFQIYLPAYKQDSKATSGERKAVNHVLRRILVMDDDKMILEITKELLQHMGYEVTTVSAGEEAVALYKEAMEQKHSFSAVILDLEISSGMDGKDTMQELLSVDPHVKAIISSGYLNNPIIIDFKDYGFSEILTKPYNANELDEKLRSVINPKNAVTIHVPVT
jgi:two-component system cell cycle sensor histidine kinase/response regulator CckA